MSVSGSLFLSLLLFLFLSWDTPLKSQAISTGSLLEEQLLIHSLLNDSLHISTVNRPFSDRMYQSQLNASDSREWWNRSLIQPGYSLPGSFTVRLLPFRFQNSMNSRFPHGENNGAAWYGRGATGELSGGLHLQSDYVTLSLQPHIIYHQNRDFLRPRYARFDEDRNIYGAEGIADFIDLPFRFGPDPFMRFDPGSSSLRVHYRSFQTGLSNEPLWWGPAQRYPLMMSNNAAGVPHFFIGTSDPVSIPYLGTFQLRWIMGYPQESGYFFGRGSGATRFLNAANFAFQPSFFPNLTVGFTRAYHLYEGDRFSMDQVSVILGPLRKVRLIEIEGEDVLRQERNQAISAYLHLRLPEAHAELFGEFYREDHSFDFRDAFQQPHHNSAYSFGLRKLIFAPFADFYTLHVEFTNLTFSQLQQVRPQAFYYDHTRIRQGHTNRGQLLGAAIGPGSNSQFISLDANRNRHRIGFYIQRVGNNDSFHFLENPPAISPSRDFGDYFRHRIDLNTGVRWLALFDRFAIHGELTWTRAYNYGRFFYGRLEGVNQTNYERFDRTNIHLQLGITLLL